MSYNKNIWKRKDRITKEKLNHMEDGIHDAHDKIKGAINDLSSQIKDIENKISVSVEDFGAKGDGVTDDTTALQNAINYCIDNNLKLVSKPNKNYLISSTLNIKGKIDIDFKDSRIFTNSVIKMINFDCPINDIKNNGYLKNIVIDMNNIALYGIYCTNLIKKVFSNIVFNKVSNTAYYFNNGYEVVLEKSHFFGSSSNSVGLKLMKGDCHYNDLFLIDIHTAIDTESTNFFTRVHAWMRTAEFIPNSKFMMCQKATSFLNQCYSDTYAYSFYVTDEYGKIKLNQHYNYYNTSFMDINAINSNGGNIYMFYYLVPTASQYTSITNSYILGIQTHKDKLLYTNIETDENKQFVDANTRIINFNENFKANKTKITSLTTTQFDLTNYSNQINKSGNIVNINLRIQNKSLLNDAQEFELLTLPEFYRPDHEIVFAAPYTLNTTYTLNSIVMINISTNGKVYMYTKDTINTNARIIINKTFISTLKQP